PTTRRKANATAPVVDSTTRARRQVMHRDVDADFSGEALQFNLPQSRARGVAAAAIGGDGQPRGARIPLLANLSPPAANGLHGEGRGVVVHADAAQPALAARS